MVYTALLPDSPPHTRSTARGCPAGGGGSPADALLREQEARHFRRRVPPPTLAFQDVSGDETATSLSPASPTVVLYRQYGNFPVVRRSKCRTVCRVAWAHPLGDSSVPVSSSRFSALPLAVVSRRSRSFHLRSMAPSTGHALPKHPLALPEHDAPYCIAAGSITLKIELCYLEHDSEIECIRLAYTIPKTPHSTLNIP